MDADDVTGPQASGIELQRRDGVVVLTPFGQLDEVLADDLREHALEAHAPVVIDLDRCVRLEGEAIRRITASWQLYRPELCFSASTAGDLRMIERSDGGEPVAVFPSVDDAIAARVAGRAAWDPSAPTRLP